jgi:hypothetical protein
MGDETMKTTLTDRAVQAAKSNISEAIVPGLLLRVPTKFKQGRPVGGNSI